MYTHRNFKTKKAFKEALANGDKITIYQPNDMFGSPEASPSYSGTAYIEGPHYPAPHTWYAKVKVENGLVVKIS